MTDEEIIEIIAKRMSDEVGWSEASKVFNHYGFVDVVTFLYSEPMFQPTLLEYYKNEIEQARFSAACKDSYDDSDVTDWKADVATRGGC